MLKGLFAISQNILADITQVDIQVTTLKGSIIISQEWIHQPELDILDIRFFKVGVIQLTHNTAPTSLWVGQLTIHVYFTSRDIVWTTLIRIVTQVHNRQFRIRIRQHLFVRIYLLLINDTSAVVRHGI